MNPTPMDRFWQKVDKQDDGCWVWTASRSSGYGRFSVDGKTRRTHRVAYEMLVGPIPSGMVLDHLCRNRACVNPDHLRVCTSVENVLAAGSLAPTKLNSERTHCPHGHAYSGENLYVDPRGSRKCRECHRKKRRRQRANRKASQHGN